MGKGFGPLQKAILKRITRYPEGLPIYTLAYRIFGKNYSQNEYQKVWNAVKRLENKGLVIISPEKAKGSNIVCRKFCWVYLVENMEKHTLFCLNYDGPLPPYPQTIKTKSRK